MRWHGNEAKRNTKTSNISNISILALPCLFFFLKCIITGFGFCDLQNLDGLGKSYQSRLRLDSPHN